MPLDVVLDDLRGVIVGGPETLVGRQKEHLRRGGIAGAELVEVLAVFVENARIAMSLEPLPQPRRQKDVRNWTPGRREG